MIDIILFFGMKISCILQSVKKRKGENMLRLDNKKLPKKFKMFIWYLMSFQAGYVNVGGFLIFGSFVSHVTGTSSQIGMGIAGFDIEKIITFMTILLSFILGAGFAGYNIGNKQVNGEKPKYVFVTGVKALLFFGVLLVSEIYFNDNSIAIKLIIIHLLSFVCGIQNATCSQATNGFLKPTHMTGLSTDIGINLFKYVKADPSDGVKAVEVQKNKTRMKILGSFIAGGAIAFFIFSQNGHYGFLFPFISSLAMLYTSIVAEKFEGVAQDLKTDLRRRFKLAQLSLTGIVATTVLIGFVGFFIK